MNKRAFLCSTGNGTFVMVGDPSDGFPYHFEKVQEYTDIKRLVETMKNRKDVGVMQDNYTENNYFFQVCQGKKITDMTTKELI